jgi:hypothetical protein
VSGEARPKCISNQNLTRRKPQDALCGPQSVLQPVDVANQYRANYDMQRPNRRTWRALFLFFLKTSIVNAYHLSRWGGHPAEDEPEEEEEEEPPNPASVKYREFRETPIESSWAYKGEKGPTVPQEDFHEWKRMESRYGQWGAPALSR